MGRNHQSISIMFICCCLGLFPHALLAPLCNPAVVTWWENSWISMLFRTRREDRHLNNFSMITESAIIHRIKADVAGLKPKIQLHWFRQLELRRGWEGITAEWMQTFLYWQILIWQPYLVFISVPNHAIYCRLSTGSFQVDKPVSDSVQSLGWVPGNLTKHSNKCTPTSLCFKV